MGVGNGSVSPKSWNDNWLRNPVPWKHVRKRKRGRLRRAGEVELEAGPRTVAVRPKCQPAADQLGPAFGERQAQANAAGRDFGVAAAAERVEDHSPVLGRDAGAAVLDLERHAAGRRPRPQPEVAVGGVPAVLAG